MKLLDGYNVHLAPSYDSKALRCPTFKTCQLCFQLAIISRDSLLVGDVYLATAFKNHDRRIPIPGFDVYGVGATDAAACPNMRAALGFKAGLPLYHILQSKTK